MRAVSDLFTAEAGSFQETMMAIRGSAGFRIPIYQRPYDWDEDHLQRLIEDCLNGFYRVSMSRNDEYTFLGTIILADDRSHEPSFEGTSFSVVDGQQRLTSLALLASALFKCIKELQVDIEALSTEAREWLREEIRYQLGMLYDCVMGPPPKFGPGGIPFPRIVRTEDTRGNTRRNSEYKSVIACLFMDFHEYSQDKNDSFDVISGESTREREHAYGNLEYVVGKCQQYLYRDGGSSGRRGADIDVDVVCKGRFASRGFRDLFDRLEILQDERVRDRVITEIAREETSAGIIRLVGFASYLAKSVILTRVVARTESSAFDIFDALNTTGEPLTALETFKPVVVEFEEGREGYVGSMSEHHWNLIDDTVTNAYVSAEQRQIETRQLLTSFALLYNGTKLSNSLATQRNYLRNIARTFPSDQPEITRNFVGLIASMADYRWRFWDLGRVGEASRDHFGATDGEIAKLCLSLIAQMRTSLAIPILARYWGARQTGRDSNEFEEVVRAITAFLVIRRAATGGTANIDGEFRSLMQGPIRVGGDPLSMMNGLSHNRLLDIGRLRAELCARLEAGIGVTDRESWIDEAESIELLRSSRPLSRFLYFAAAHNARRDRASPGLLTRDGVNVSPELEVLNLRSWQSDRYSTVEHIAPDSGPGGGWDEEIYTGPTRNSLGNMILLPPRANAAIGNAPWEKKQMFYRALMARTKPERDLQIENSEAIGLRFTNRTKELLETQERLHILDPLEHIDQWTVELVKERTRNVLQLAWDQIGHWLYDQW